MKDTLEDRYVRVDDYASRVKGLDFGPQIWAVFGQLAELRSGAQIAAALSLGPDVVDGALRRLLAEKLIRKEAAVARVGTAPASVAPVAAVPVKPGVKAPPAVTPAPAAKTVAKPVAAVAPAAPASAAAVSTAAPVVFLRLGSEKALKSAKEPLVTLRVSRVLPSVEKCAPWKLRPVLDAIGQRAGGGVTGQLLVYKMFLQLPPDLLKAAGVESLSTVDENFTVTHAAFRPALIEVARLHANIDITSLLAA